MSSESQLSLPMYALKFIIMHYATKIAQRNNVFIEIEASYITLHSWDILVITLIPVLAYDMINNLLYTGIYHLVQIIDRGNFDRFDRSLVNCKKLPVTFSYKKWEFSKYHKEEFLR